MRQNKKKKQFQEDLVADLEKYYKIIGGLTYLTMYSPPI